MKPTSKLTASTLWLAALFLVFSNGRTLVHAKDAPKPSPPVAIKFRPPATGAPAVRVTGGSRGSGEAAVTLDVLAPDDVGATTKEQPSLFWFQSRPATARFELTVVEENKVKPVVHVTINRAAQAGIQRLRLADHNAKLVPGVEYQWVVALVTDPDNRSTDLIASGVIKRVPASVELSEKVSKAQPADLPGIYADAGIWYDAFAVLSDQIDANPNDKTLRKNRADLLEQVGLKAAAQFEASVQ